MSKVLCIDCGKTLDDSKSWEPTLVPLDWAVDTGRHAAICYECIADVYACLAEYSVPLPVSLPP